MEKKSGFMKVAFVLILVFLLLVGCSSNSETSQKDSDGDVKKIKFVAAQYSDATEPYLQGVIDKFEEENPDIKVELEVIGWDVIEQKVNTMVATNQTPDLLNTSQFAAFAEDGLLLPVEDVISQELQGKFYESFFNANTVDGKVYALPFLASIRGLFYNKDLFEEAGIKEAPKTWKELVEVSKKIKEKTGKDGFGIPMTNFEGQAYFSYFTWGNGGGWKKDDKWALNSPENVEALEFMSELVHEHKVTNPEPTAINRDEMHKVFGSGELGMMISANFLPTILAKDAPDLNYGVSTIPVNDGKDPFNLGVEDVLMVFKSTKHPDAVGKFLEYFYSAENHEQFMKNEGMLPVIEEVGESMASKDPEKATFIEQLPVAKFYPTTDPTYTEVRLGAIKATQQVLLKELSAKEALDALQAEIE
ncbi:sugar ABC transporter substrate-binding protein [Fredinandcohnia sp. QZ13]|uniref:ABC transporter substrate-binding protein n=1 Tax=Fredinandcohnia sp. QZ13 TaxID=3073144 RepID=UPI0028531548|nr:sugar ABC transporter substrate-binding protein [Fredinandcohnia sp. QZ13]MDR4887492.1 sugar ABC transporter substrate-binding protein [Fredinandcohnia sp. QZ13]